MVAQFPPGDEIMHILWGKKYADELAKIFRHTFATGESYATSHRAELRADRGVVEHYQWRVDRITLPDGSFGVVCYFRDASLKTFLHSQDSKRTLAGRICCNAKYRHTPIPNRVGHYWNPNA